MFIPEQIGWDLIRNWDVTEDDHPYAELGEHSFVGTDMEPTSEMSVDQMLVAFRNCKGKWDSVRFAPVLD